MRRSTMGSAAKPLGTAIANHYSWMGRLTEVIQLPRRDLYREVSLCLPMERGGDCDCCFCMSHCGAGANLDRAPLRSPEVGFAEIAVDLLQAGIWIVR